MCSAKKPCQSTLYSEYTHTSLFHPRYTCDECVQGLEWVEMYLEDPIMIAEFRIYLEQNFCLSDWDDCKQLVEEHFTAMHVMAMEKFFIPVEICMQEPVCGGSPTFPPKPTDKPDV